MPLNGVSLSKLARSITVPDFDRRSLSPGIVHLGLGGFFRAHGAAYTDGVLAADPQWGIIAASLRSPETRDALAPQDGLYTLAERSGDDEKLRVIGAIGRVLVAPEDPVALLAAMVDPRVRIVSLTITEKGYCHDPATGELNEAHPDILHDLAHPASPRSAPGFIVEALSRRRSAGAPPFALLSCDNLPSNGHVTKRIVSRFAQLRDADLAAFLEGDLACPSTMVDRITPATTDEDRTRIAERLGVADAWPVVTEPFSQWVIEDLFPAGRPSWDTQGAEFVADVEPYELMKLRLLNGAHSSIAYLGYLAGYETVSQTIADPAFSAFARGIMDEASPTLAMPAGTDLASYKAALLMRFQNPALKHRTWQICMDGSQKLPQRLLGTVRQRLREGAPFPHIALGIAGWMRYVTGLDESGGAIDVSDPLAAKLRSLSDEAGLTAERLAPALLSLPEIFGTDLPANPRFRGAVADALGRLLAMGARRSVAEVAKQ